MARVWGVLVDFVVAVRGSRGLGREDNKPNYYKPIWVNTLQPKYHAMKRFKSSTLSELFTVVDG